MALDLTTPFEWVRTLMRTDEASLPDEELELIGASTANRLLGSFPALQTAYGADLSSMTAAQRAFFDEAAGHLIAARFIVLPRPEGEELVTRFQIGPLQEQYKVPDMEALAARWVQDAYDALALIPAFKEAIVAAYKLPAILFVNPTREGAAITARPTVWKILYSVACDDEF